MHLKDIQLKNKTNHYKPFFFFLKGTGMGSSSTQFTFWKKARQKKVHEGPKALYSHLITHSYYLIM